MIKYFCFDIGGVANIQTPSYLLLSAAQKRWNGFSENDWKKMVFPAIEGRDVWREFQDGAVTAEQYLDLSFSMVKVPNTNENRKIFRSLLEDWCGQPYQPMLHLVEQLNKQGFYTSVLSNNNEIMYGTPSAEIKNRVHVSLSSHLIRYSKPDPKAFKKLLWVTGAKPGELVFIDDKIRNIESARRLGMQGFHFRSKEIQMDEAFKELLDFLVRI